MWRDHQYPMILASSHMSFQPKQEQGARTSTNPTNQNPNLKLSQAAADFMAQIEARELDPETVSEYRTAIWYLIEFVGCDAPLSELTAETPARFIDWLRKKPIAPRLAKTRPKTFTAAAVSAFFQWPPRTRQTTRLRTEQTVGKYWRTIAPFLQAIGLPTELRKRGPGRRPCLDLPPALVPMKAQIVAWWQDTLTAAAMRETTKRRCPPTARQRRRVLLVQGLVYLTGLRIEEALAALLRDLQGHWLLVRQSKTHKPRIVYLNAQALGLVEALHSPRQTLLYDLGEEPGARKHRKIVE